MQGKRNEKLLITKARVMNSFGSEQGQAAGCYFSGTVLSSSTKFGELLGWLKTLLACD
jgi:hypothetical protein